MAKDIYPVIEYSEVQNEAFFETRAKFNIYPKGRRTGFTRGGMQAAIEWALDGEQVLWGDTILDNIKKYIERYGVPFMKAQGIPYDWNITNKVIKFPGGGYIDFRSADRPENWEGFGYNRILLNEAGIILEEDHGKHLYLESVLPMLLDFPESQLYAFGVPKGTTSIYHDLWQRAISGTEDYNTKTYTSYDTPYLTRKSIEFLESEMLDLGGKMLVDQEVYGKFVNIQGDGLRVFPELWVRAAFARWEALAPSQHPTSFPDAVGVDVGRGGRDATIFSKRWDDYFGELISHRGEETKDGEMVASLLAPHLGPHTKANIDVVGVGVSAYDHIKRNHKGETHGVNGGLRGDLGRDKADNFDFYNLRAKLYWQFRESLDPANNSNIALPPDEQLLVDLISTGWRVRDQAMIVEPKEDIIKRLGRSPDKADGVIYATYEDPGTGFDFFMDVI